jgi:hypothetical protein
MKPTLFPRLALSLLTTLLAGVAQAAIETCNFDGDDFYVHTDHGTYRQSVDAFADSQYDCSDSLAAIYDGDDFYVFNDKTLSFYRMGAEDNFSYAKLVVTDTLAGVYDGDDFYVFDASFNNFSRQGVDDYYSKAAIAGLRNGIILYDGDDVYAFCRGNFSRDGNVDDNAVGYSGRRGIQVNDASYTIDSNCTIKRWRN